MKKIFLVTMLSTICLSSAFAGDNFTALTTVEEAQQYCPPINGLTFTPNNPSVPNSAGTIAGYNRIAFESLPKKSPRPKNMDGGGLISDAQFRSVDGLYGYISNNVVTCLYSYTSFTDVQYGLIMRGK